MGRYSDWANDDSPIVHSTSINRSTPPPPPQPAPVVQTQQPTPPRAPALIQIPHFGIQQRPVQLISPVPEGCTIVKGGQPEWSAVMSNFPDIAQQSGIDYAGGVDAMRDFTGRPDQAVMAHWTPNAQYYNRTSDSQARGRIDEYIPAKHSTSLSDVRQSGYNRPCQVGGYRPIG